MKRLANKGDTIVEVLICISVVSLVLGGAFASANRSLNATSAAKERDQGVRLAETQLEQLKSFIKDSTKAASVSNDADGFFCMANTEYVDINRIIPDNVTADVFSSPAYPVGCVLNSSNGAYATSDFSIPYYVSLQQDSSDGNLFTVRIRWERAGGEGREEASLVYRTYR
jgi:type II secretory pathway pseudopilin PulG